MKIIVRLLITTFLVVIIAHFLPGVTVVNYEAALYVALVLGLLNAFLKPLLILFTLPATILTLGLFLLVINAIIIMVGDYLLDGFMVNGFWNALFFSIILSFGQSILNSFFSEEAKQSKKKNTNN
jgi:putative membrane protein